VRWRVGVLGPVGVVVEGNLVTPGSGVVRATLAALAVSAGAPVGVTRLARSLWNGHGDVPNPARRTQLAVHRLRRWLSATVGDAVQVRTTVAGYELRVVDDGTDLDAFRALVAAAATGPPAARLATLVAALDLWRGPVLDTVPDERLDPAVTRAVDNERRATRQSAARLALATGDADLAISLAEEACRTDPFDEAAHATLMEALAVSGRQAEALRRFRELSTTLRDALGVDPGDLVRAAHLRILRQELPAAGPTHLMDTAPVDNTTPTDMTQTDTTQTDAAPPAPPPAERALSDVDTRATDEGLCLRLVASAAGRRQRPREYAVACAVRHSRSAGGGVRRPTGTARPPP
jgi:DNA-binding SARP family transcriptional activator